MMYIVDIGRIGLCNGPCVYKLSVSSIINKTPTTMSMSIANFFHDPTEREKEMQN